MPSIVVVRGTLRATVSMLLMLAGGCAVGPDFTPPAAPAPARYAAQATAATAATPGVAAGAAQRFEAGGYLPEQWWTAFHSSAIDALVTLALSRNHDLKAAQAALRAAHEDTLAQRGAFWPAAAAGLTASRQGTSRALAPTPNYPDVPEQFQYNLITPQLSVSYTPDVFGLSRRGQESLAAQEQAARFQMLAVRTTLASNVVVTAIEEAALADQLHATNRLVVLQARSLALLQLRLRKGDASQLDVAAQRTQVAQTRALEPPIVKQMAQTHDALAALVGATPGEPLPRPVTLDGLQLPARLPLSLPSQLVAQRPDVRQARANLHAASAAIGIAAAQRLPQIDLTADIGKTALQLSRVFDPGTGFWGLTAAMTAPLFEGRSLLHQERAAKAAYAAAQQQYRQAVVTAFQDVSDTLAALHADAVAVHAAAAARAAAQAGLDLSRLRLAHGAISALELIAAQQAYQQAQIALVQAQANRYTDTVALYQALGGGWWHDPNLATPRPRP